MIKVCVFDAYGTLFDVSAAARKAATEPNFSKLKDVWPKVANDWRLKQLQYTWLRAITKNHCDFWQVTQDGLDFALENSGLNGDDALRQRLLDLYWELEAYGEVPQMLSALKTAGTQTAILSNGSPDMLDGAVESANLSDLLDAVISVEDVGVFKPDASVYQLVCDWFDCKPENVLFVSSNGWDVAGASGFGFQTTWVNRAGEPVDRLPHGPKFVLSDLTDIPKIFGTLS
ncbi:haloacid dehalogenase, type II [Amylibacter kogurei]|uniref:(S)-2-haloacid dehalogenase n=1 Tax=Paramylibacter kogurei TaxID=1889778 RepID=A0A2G5K5H7_9RHOB|nr:haloacid dehalogenase type II [Amylibacter kogurei]PIB23964.1 haloacid dehalogenase, type II [Amylibacter kogurei]